MTEDRVAWTCGTCKSNPCQCWPVARLDLSSGPEAGVPGLYEADKLTPGAS